MTEQALKSVHIDNRLVEKIHIEQDMTLTLNQQKLILYLASLIDDKSSKLQDVELSFSDFFNIIDRPYSGRSKELLEKNLINLGSKCFFLPDTTGNYKILCRWLDTINIDYNKNIIHLKLSDTLAPYFLNLAERARTIFQLGYILQFRKSYSIDLYIYFCRFKNLNYPVTMAVEEAKARFGNGTYKKYSDLMRFVIKPAIVEINEKSDLNISVKPITNKKKTSHICFYITKKIKQQKIEAESWKRQLKKPGLNQIVKEAFENEMIEEAQERNIISNKLNHDDIDYNDFDLDTLASLKKHKNKVSKNAIDNANKTNLIDFLETVHPDRVRYHNGNLVNEDHDSLVIFNDGYYRYSNGESGSPVYYLTQYLDYNLNEAVKTLTGFVSSVERTRTLVNRPESVHDTFYKPIKNALADKAVKDYLIKDRALDSNLVDKLYEDSKIYSATVRGHGKQYACFANNNMDFYILRNTEVNGIQKLIASDCDNGFWFFVTEHKKTCKSYFDYFKNQNEEYEYSLPLYICESAIDSISLFCLTGCAGIYTAMAGLKNKTFENIINAFPNATEIILAVDNDPSGDRFCEYKNYKRIIPKEKDWNEDLQNKKRA